MLETFSLMLTKRKNPEGIHMIDRILEQAAAILFTSAIACMLVAYLFM